MKKPWRYIKTHWRLLLLATSFSVVLVVFFNILWGDPNLAVAIVAFGTLMLALVTAVSIDNSRQQEKRRRKEGLLNEIIEWAMDIAKPKYALNLMSLASTTISVEDQATVLQLSQASYTHTLIVRGNYIAKISLVFTKDLTIAVEKGKDDLEKHADLIHDWIDGKTTSEAIGKHDHALGQSANKVIEEAVKIKTKEIGEGGEKNMPKEKEDEATGSNELSLKHIEEHLKRQDRQTKQMIYFAGAAFGASIILVAVSLWIGKVVLSATAFFWQYIFLLAVGFGFMSWFWYKQSKVK